MWREAKRATCSRMWLILIVESLWNVIFQQLSLLLIQRTPKSWVVFFLNHLLASPCVTLKKKKKIVERSKEKTKNNPLELDTDLASNPDFQWALASIGLASADVNGGIAISYNSYHCILLNLQPFILLLLPSNFKGRGQHNPSLICFLVWLDCCSRTPSLFF